MRKVCADCGKNRLLKYYRKYQPHCIDCERKHTRWRMGREENRIRTAYRGAKRKAQQFGVYDDLTYDDVAYLFKIANYRCAYTGKLTGNLSLEHVIPLSKGGPNTIGNLVVVDLTANKKKQNGNVLDFMFFRGNMRGMFDLIELIAARGNRSYRRLLLDIEAHQQEENNALYERTIGRYLRAKESEQHAK